MSENTPISFLDQNVETVNITTEMKNCYIDYAMSVIVGRALPDVRDGLKPVHRRILYAMNELGLMPQGQFRKSVRIVGDVLGKYHPHGDASVYDAMVRMAQDFNTRYPTVKGHGNFGSIDGDSAAAMRYTEAKMDFIAQEMLRDINKNTVNFIDNFDGSETEPEVLTARFPHLLVNGSQGIAVGMATNMPPHNIGEVIEATVAYIDNPSISVDKLMEKMPGPDFPTGGIVMGNEGIKQAYSTGKGKLKIRGRAKIEPSKRGKNQIIITEIPYMVNKAKLNEKIHTLAVQGKIKGIAETRDESDLKQGIRLVVETRKGFDPNIILNQIYKYTDLETSYGITNLALVPDEQGKLHPGILSLPEILNEYLKHQKEVIIRRTQFDLDKAEKRAHILEGLLTALDNIDEVIEIIRHSRDGKSASNKLQKRFKLTEIQAQAILDMRLQRLTGLERGKLKSEYKELQKQIARYKKILSDEKEVLKVIKTELLEIKEKYTDARRTQIGEKVDVKETVTFEKKDIEVIFTANGYLNSKLANSNRQDNISDGDFIFDRFIMSNTDSLVLVSSTGRVYVLKGTDIPDQRNKGVFIKNLLNLKQDEKIISVFPVSEFNSTHEIAMATSNGLIKRTPLTEFATTRKTGGSAINLKSNEELRDAFLIPSEGAEIIIATRNGLALRTDLSKVTPTSRLSAGVKGISIDEDTDTVIGMQLAKKYLITATENGYVKATELKNYKKQARGGKGLLSTQSRKHSLAGIVCVDDFTKGVILDTEKGPVVVEDIPLTSRAKAGEVKTENKVIGAYPLK